MIRLLLAFVALLLPSALAAQGAVSSADPRATQAGQEILRQGGSAADAAMAIMLALTVVEPQSSGIGGGGFLIHHDAKQGLVDTIDGREKAPAAATQGRFLGADGQPVPYMVAIAGGKSVGVPGNIRLMAMAHAKWGKLPWKALFQPAIRLADKGFAVTRPLAGASANLSPVWLGVKAGSPIQGSFPETAKLYAPGGKPLTEGQTLRNPALAKTLRKIADDGADAFYTGDNAAALVKAVNGTRVSPSDMTLADLAAYEAKARPAVCSKYRTWRVCGMGPPSSGATTVFQILGMLERFDMKALGKDSPVAWHLIAEAMQLAYADREMYLADRDFVEVPVAGLLDPAYMARRSRLISFTRARNNYEAGSPPGAPQRIRAVQNEVPATTHFVAVDRDGNVANMTSTIEGPFGSQLIAGGYALNNELTDFTRAPVQDGYLVANRVEGGKRPLSSMSPTIVYDASGTPIFTVGAAGGKTIIMQVAKAIIAHLDWGLPSREALGEGLVYYDDDGLILERGTAREGIKPALEGMGHKVVIGPLGLKANAAERTANGWVGAADPRSIGTAATE
jgi:gamma-glutamyltranspeptidase/glutathione hydrolase